MAATLEVPRVKVFVPCFSAVELARNTDAALIEPVANTVAVFTAPVTLRVLVLTNVELAVNVDPTENVPVLTLVALIRVLGVELPIFKTFNVPVPRMFPSMMAVVLLAMKTLIVPNWFPMV